MFPEKISSILLGFVVAQIFAVNFDDDGSQLVNIGQVVSSSKQNPAQVPINVLRNLKVFIPYLDCTNMISFAGRTDSLQGFVSTVTRRKQKSTTRGEAGEKTFLYITESTLSIFLALLTMTKNLNLKA